LISAVPTRVPVWPFIAYLLSWVLSVAGPILIYREAEKP